MFEEVERRRGYAGALASLAFLSLIVYFTYSAVQGSYGLMRLFQAEAQGQQLDRELSRLRAERKVMENKTRRLSSEFLDLDLLDEQARKVLGLTRGDEIVIR